MQETSCSRQHSAHEHRVARSATETECIQCGAGTDLRRLLRRLLRGKRLLGLPNQTELQHRKTRRGPTPRPDFGGSEKVENWPLAIMRASNARSNLVRAMGPHCRCAVPNATAARVGVRARGAWGVQPTRAARRNPATLKNGVQHVMEKAEAHGGPLRSTEGTGCGKSVLRMWVVAHA